MRKKPRPSADRILVAAEALFSARGYAEVSLRQLIAHARVSTTAFYARFDSKAAVLQALAGAMFVDLHRAAADALRSVRDLDDGIVRGAELIDQQLGARRALVRMILAEAGGVPELHAIRRASYAGLVAFLAAHLRGLTARRRVRVADPEALAFGLVGALELQVTRWAVWDELDRDELAPMLVRVARATLPKEPRR